MVAILSALLVVMTFLLKIPLPQPLFYWGLAPILIYTVGIMFRPWIAFLICALGSVLGEWFNCLVAGCGAELPIYLLGMLVARGLEGALISALRHWNEIGAMIAGGLWEFFGFLLIGGIYYGVVLELATEFWLPFYFGTLLDLLLIPVAVALNKALRAAFDVQYLDELIG